MPDKAYFAAYARKRYQALTQEERRARNSSPVALRAKAKYRSKPENRRKEVEQNKRWLARDGNGRWKQFQKRLNTYGLTLDQYHALAERQEFVCASCGEEPSAKRSHASIDNFVIDHDHATGKVRGLLCHYCNTAIGHLRDCTSRALAALNYLERHHANG